MAEYLAEEVDCLGEADVAAVFEDGGGEIDLSVVFGKNLLGSRHLLALNCMSGLSVADALLPNFLVHWQYVFGSRVRRADVASFEA